MSNGARARPLLGITMGEPDASGPEIIAKAISADECWSVCSPLVIGDAGVMQCEVATVGTNLEVVSVDPADDLGFPAGTLAVLDQKTVETSNFRVGKVLAMSGVNVTPGLPIVRASVDYGTSFDIAGTGKANAQRMLQAIRYEAMLYGHRDNKGNTNDR